MNQLAITFPAEAHRRVRHKRAQEATDRADSDCPSWSEIAYAFLCRFAREREGEWLSEELIYASRGSVPAPADKKAWGGVVARAARNGVIRHVGWSDNTRNASPKKTWMAAK